MPSFMVEAFTCKEDTEGHPTHSIILAVKNVPHSNPRKPEPGYGFPNLDKNYLPDEFYGAVNAYKGTQSSQTGPFTGALDFQFSRYNSIGIMGTYGKQAFLIMTYSSNSPVPSFNGDLTSWSVMLNMMTYFPSYKTVSPYIRTAIGINNRTENYIYPDGTKAIEGGNDISDLAYQVSIGTRFNLSPNAGFYIEAGYGKYIVNGGLTFRFNFYNIEECPLSGGTLFMYVRIKILSQDML
jgi:hypothetical protein